jgi:hypothetical protein
MMDLFTMISNGMLEDTFFLVPFIMMLTAMILAFWRPFTILVISSLACAAAYGWANGAGSDALAILPIIIMARWAVGVSAVIFLARLIGGKKNK